MMSNAYRSEDSPSPVETPRLQHSQNFLRSAPLVSQLLGKTSITGDDLVVEIGPGEGIITAELARRCAKVLAIEKDPILHARLGRKFAAFPNVELHRADILEFRLPIGAYKVFSNIPFSITADIIRKLTETQTTPSDTYLIVQRAAAERFAGVSHGKETQVSVLLKPFYTLSIMHQFRRTDFFPVPRVDIVMLRIEKRDPPRVRSSEAQLYRDFVVYAFNRWKPTLQQALADVLTPIRFSQVARTVHLSPSAKPTQVEFEQWLGLFEAFLITADERRKNVVRGSERKLRKQQDGLQKIHRTRVAQNWRERSTRKL